MKRKAFILTVVSAYLILFSIQAYCGEVTITVTSIPPRNSSVENKQPESSSIPITIKAYSPGLVLLFQGKAEITGKFKIQVPGSEQYDWLLVEVARGEDSIRGVYSGEPIELSPASDVLASAILNMPDMRINYSNAEINLIKNKLAQMESGISSAKTFDEILANPGYRLALGDLLVTYGTPGDTIEEVNKAIVPIRSFVDNFKNLKKDDIKSSFATDGTMELYGDWISADMLEQVITDFEKANKVLEWTVDFARVPITGDISKIETIEDIRLKEKSTGEELHTILNFIYDVEKVDEKWSIKKRYTKECTVEKAHILIDGSSMDWVGIRPCYMDFKPVNRTTKHNLAITNLYFAIDENDFYWRMEFEGSSPLLSDKSDNQSKTEQIIFATSFEKTFDGSENTPLISTVVKSGSEVSSFYNTHGTAIDGFPDNRSFVSEEFFVSPHYAEGSFSLDIFETIGYELFINARIFSYTQGGDTKIISQGVASKITIPHPTE